MAPIPVWVGATIALVMVSALGVWAGRTVLQRLPLHWLHRAGGGIFLVFATMAGLARIGVMLIENPEPVTLELMAIGVASFDSRRRREHAATYGAS